MHRRVHHVFIALSTAVFCSACSPDDCEQNPDSIFCVGDSTETETETETETGDNPQGDLCVPLKEGATGGLHPCFGLGNGWLEVDVHPLGPQPIECVNWGEAGEPQPPAKPTPEDCVPLDLTQLPDDIPAPGACCTNEAMASEIIAECNQDCGYAACKLAIEKIEAAALALSDGGAEGVARADLLAMAAGLAAPDILDYCANQVAEGEGEVVTVSLGEGMSEGFEFGHVNDATLYLQCALDQDLPFEYPALDSECETTPNIPTADGESNLGGEAALGAVSIYGPDGFTDVTLYDVDLSFTETYNRDGSTDFLLREFSARAEPGAHGAFAVEQGSLTLASPASATLVDELVRFAPGTLRLRATGRVAVDGKLLFEGEPVSATYVNTSEALARRGDAGTFAFVEAPFEASGYTFVLNTEDTPVELR